MHSVPLYWRRRWGLPSSQPTFQRVHRLSVASQINVVWRIIYGSCCSNEIFLLKNSLKTYKTSTSPIPWTHSCVSSTSWYNDGFWQDCWNDVDPQPAFWAWCKGSKKKRVLWFQLLGSLGTQGKGDVSNMSQLCMTNAVMAVTWNTKKEHQTSLTQNLPEEMVQILSLRRQVNLTKN